MDYQFREIVAHVVTDLHDGTVTIVKNTNHMTPVSVEDAPENGMRVFAHNGTLFIKALTSKPADIHVYIPESVKTLKLESAKSDFILTELELDAVSCSTTGDCSMHGITVNKQCDLNCEQGDISLQECSLRSLNIQLIGGSLETWHTALSGNNMIFVQKSTMNCNLKGALVDYVISAGSGISPDDLIVNDHPLSEFPDRKNTHEAAWVLIAGHLMETTHIYIKKS